MVILFFALLFAMSFATGNAVLKCEEEGCLSNVEPSTNKITLKEFITTTTELQPFADELYTKLTSSDIDVTNIDTLIMIDENDLNDLCQELQLSFKQKLKFKTAIRTLQKKYETQTIVTISQKEEILINNIDTAISKSLNIHQLLQEYSVTIDNHVSDIIDKIDLKIDAIIQSLQTRKNALHEQVNKWKVRKSSDIQKELKNQNESYKVFRTNKIAINDILSNVGAIEREKKIEGIINDLFVHNDVYKMYKDDVLLREYINQNTQQIDVMFQDELNINNIEFYADFNEAYENKKFQIPVLKWIDIVVMEDELRLKWIFNSITNIKTTGFEIKYCQNNVLECTTISGNDLIIEQETDNKYVCDMPNNLKDDIQYNFHLEKIISKPIYMMIKSNTKSVKIDGFQLNLYQEEKINMVINAHNGHWSNWVPERMLRSNDNAYASKKGHNRDDWVTFSIFGDHYYYPTKLQIRTPTTPESVKRFRLKIGCVVKNEWILLNEQLFIARKTNNILQTFNLDIMSGMNDSDIRSKWKLIKQQKYKHFKLELLDNHGNPNHITIIEFRIFGVKI